MITWAWTQARRSLHWLMFGSHFGAPWPVHPTTKIYRPENIQAGPDSPNVFLSAGCVWNAEAKIKIGSHCWIGQNVGLITANHDIRNPDNSMPGKPITIGDYCWIGMNAVILPGVSLGDHTTVGAGAVVTKSFPEGYQVIAGNPAKVIKRI